MTVGSVSAMLRSASALTVALGVFVAVSSVLAIPRSLFAFAGVDVPDGTIRVVAGAALVGAGVLTWLDRPTAVEGMLATLAGAAFMAPAWEAWVSAPAIVRSVAMVAQPFFLPLVAHLVVLILVRRPWVRALRFGIAAGYTAATVVALGMALFRDPFLDTACLFSCRYNVFLVSAQPAVVRAVSVAWQLVSLGMGVWLVVMSVRGLVSATRTAAALRWPILVAAGIVGAEAVVSAVVVLSEPTIHPFDPRLSALFPVRASGVGALATAVAVRTLRTRRTRRDITRLGIRLGEAPSPGTLGAALAHATGDATLTVYYPLPGGARYVDAGGRAVAPPAAGDGRAVTPVVLRGRPIAFVEHDAATLDADDIRQQLGSAARLAIENERLRAEVLAQLEDLRASRARLVEVGDAERRRLERDLHDGAQQRLLALGYDVRLARAAAVTRGDGRVVELLGTAMGDIDRAVSELRDLAHGIYPAILTEAGIGPAVWSLTDASRVPVDVIEVPDERFPDAVERTAFEIVVEGVDAADPNGSGPIRVQVAQEGDRLVVEVDGTVERPFVYLADRVGALGGILVTEPSRLRAEIPCGSS